MIQNAWHLIVAAIFAALNFVVTTSITKADTFGNTNNNFNIDFVEIGYVDNPADPTSSPPGIGSVGYVYRISKFETTEHMIAVANDASQLGISYSSRGKDKPVTQVNWNEAARFVNWLNTSKGYPPAYKFSIQPGSISYDPNANAEEWLPSDPGYDAVNPWRNSHAAYFLPSESEWFKAAYYNPGATNYFVYPTRSDNPPTPVSSGTNANTAVYFQQSTPANVQDAGGLSSLGTMGQGGNVWEFMETQYDPSSLRRVIRGGSFDNYYYGSPEFDLASTNRFVGELPTYEDDNVGFRVASKSSGSIDADGDGVNDYREIKDGTDPQNPDSFKPLSRGLIAYYPFNEGLNDESGYGKHLDLFGDFEFVPDLTEKSGQALRSPSRVNGGVMSTKESGIVGNAERTISFWFRSDGPQAWPNGNVVLLGSRVAVDRGRGSIQIDNGYRNVETPPIDYLHQRVHHFVWTYQNNLGDSRFYINGQPLELVFEDGFGDPQTTLEDVPDGPIKIMGGPSEIGFGDRGFQGEVDNVRLYNRALSANEALQLFEVEAGALDSDQDGLIDLVELRLAGLGFDPYSPQDSDTVQQIFSNPNLAGLFTQAQYDGAFEQGRLQGRDDVVSQPGLYRLFNENSLADINLGGVVLRKLGNTVNLEVQVQMSPDINSQPFSNLPYRHLLYIDGLPHDKAFLRIRALGPQ